MTAMSIVARRAAGRPRTSRVRKTLNRLPGRRWRAQGLLSRATTGRRRSHATAGGRTLRAAAAPSPPGSRSVAWCSPSRRSRADQQRRRHGLYPRGAGTSDGHAGPFVRRGRSRDHVGTWRHFPAVRAGRHDRCWSAGPCIGKEIDLHAGIGRFVIDELMQIGRRANLYVAKIRSVGEMAKPSPNTS